MRIVVTLLATSLALGCGDDVMPTTDAGPDAGHDAGDDFHDPLSMPEQPTLDMAEFVSAEECGSCHETHLSQWRSSLHAYAMVDPVFRALVAVRQADYEGTQDQFCTQCHSAIGTRGGAIVDGFSFEDLPPIVLEGITCDACHRVSGLQRDHNSGHVIDPSGAVRGPIEEPMSNPFHASVYEPLFETSEFCAACHDVIEVSGLNLERPYEEWLESPAPAAGETCQSCHMPTYRGRATDVSPERDLHDHTFVGVDVPLTEGFLTAEEETALEARVVELLDGAARLQVGAVESIEAGDQIDLFVTVRNLISGHNLPTGSTFVRQMWVEVVATDMGTSEVLYETGTLDADGDLRDHFSALDPYGDSDLIVFHSSLLDASGEPEIFTWRATEHVLRAIPPEHSRTNTLFIPTPETVVGPISIRTRLRFRTHPPFLLRALGLDELIERVVIHDLVEATTVVEVVTP